MLSGGQPQDRFSRERRPCTAYGRRVADLRQRVSKSGRNRNHRSAGSQSAPYLFRQRLLLSPARAGLALLLRTRLGGAACGGHLQPQCVAGTDGHHAQGRRIFHEQVDTPWAVQRADQVSAGLNAGRDRCCVE